MSQRFIQHLLYKVTVGRSSFSSNEFILCNHDKQTLALCDQEIISCVVRLILVP